MLADRECELLTLKRVDYLGILSDFPKYEDELKEIATNRKAKNKSAILAARQANFKLDEKKYKFESC